MKASNAGKVMLLRAQITNQNLKQNAETQDVYRHASLVCIIYDTVTGYISTIIHFMGWVVSEPSAPHVSAEVSATRHANKNRVTSPVARTL